MQIEMYVGIHPNVWYTIYIEIPDSTPEDKIHDTAMQEVQRELSSPKYMEQMIAFYGVYHIEVPSSEGRDE